MDERLKKVFADALGLAAQETDWENLAYRGIPQWDSVAHMALVGEIEDEFDIMLETDDVIGMNSFAVAKEIVARYGVADG